MKRVACLVFALFAFVAPLAAAGFDELSDARARLGSSDARERRAAVGQLARIGTLEAWKSVLAALADSDGQVADEAQLQLVSVATPEARKLVLGKDGLAAKNALVRERVVESFGRASSAPPADVFAQALGDREASVRRAAGWSVERLARAQKYVDAWKTDMIEASALEAALAAQIGREKDLETQATLIVAQQALLGAPRRKDIETWKASKSAPARAAAAIALGAPAAADSLDLLTALAADANFGVRANAFRSLAAHATKAAAQQLVAALEREESLRGKWLLAGHLRALSGLSHRLDPRPWKQWVESLADGAIAAPERAERSSDEAGSTSAFAGLPIHSERVAFLIDLSGSMWEKRADGRTRKELVDEELARALRSLSPQTRFNVIVYTARPVAWKERLTPAAPKAVAEALEFFTKRVDRGTGDFWGALEFALADPELDTLIVLSDGAPSGGQRWNMELIASLFEERTRLRGLVLDVVLADAPKALREHWRRMAERSGGSTVEIALK